MNTSKNKQKNLNPNSEEKDHLAICEKRTKNLETSN